MDDAGRGPAFLVRFDARRDQKWAGVATHIQSGERIPFTGLREVVRIFRARLGSEAPPATSAGPRPPPRERSR